MYEFREQFDYSKVNPVILFIGYLVLIFGMFSLITDGVDAELIGPESWLYGLGLLVAIFSGIAAAGHLFLVTIPNIFRRIRKRST